MKVITKCIIRIDTLETLYEESYEYKGSIAKCKGGGGSSGGGASGKVDFPDYMKTWHGQALDHAGVDTVASSVTDIINAALGNSPFAGVNAYDPDADITAYEAAIAGFDVLIAGIDEPVDWAALYTQAVASIDGVSNAEITADVVAFAAEQDDQLTTIVLPRFESGMRDIGAVVSSAFAIGKSNIEGFRDRDVARHSSKIRLAVVSDRGRLYLEGTSQMMQFLQAKYAWEESYMKTVIEGKRIKIVAKKEQTEVDMKIDEADSLWDFGVFRYGTNMLASISGSAVSEDSEMKSNLLPSVIGGALSGAAAGTMIGGPGWGTAIGAVAGAGMAFLQ